MKKEKESIEEIKNEIEETNSPEINKKVSEFFQERDEVAKRLKENE